MVIQLHENQRGQVRLNGDLSEPFPISKGVKQGCVLAPTLFSIFFSMMLKQATEDLVDDDGEYVRYRLDSSLFNLRRLQAHTKTQERLIQDLLFADDPALVAHTERALQRVTSCFADASRLFSLEVSLKKREILHQPTPHEAMSLKYQLRWAGHVSRMEDHRLPKIVMFGELSSGHRERGAPKKRFKDSLKKSLTACNIDHRQWSDLAADRVVWRHTIHQAAAQFEVDRKNSLKDKRQRRKARAASTTTPNISFPCSHCSRPCLSRIGLVSHERACSRRQLGLTS